MAEYLWDRCKHLESICGLEVHAYKDVKGNHFVFGPMNQPLFSGFEYRKALAFATGYKMGKESVGVQHVIPERHSVNCICCGKMLDERIAITDIVEGSACRECARQGKVKYFRTLKIEPELFADLVRGNLPATGENILEEPVEFSDGRYMMVYYTAPNHVHASLFEPDDTYIASNTMKKFGEYQVENYTVTITY